MISKIWSPVKEWLEFADRRNVSLISAGVAFYGVLAIFPAIAATIAIFGLIADPSVVEEQLQLGRNFIPPGVFDIFQQQIDSLLSTRRQTLGLTTLISILLALWSARGGVAALMRGINAIYDRPNRKGIRHIFVAMLLTISLVGMAMVALALIIVVPIVLNFLPIIDANGYEFLRWSAGIAVLLLSLGLLYRFALNRRDCRVPWVTIGSVIVILLWFTVSYGFSAYVSNFSNYNEVYGSLGAGIALMLWFFITAYLILFGAAINRWRELQRRRSQV